jgi:Nucleotidyl transferase AbiEii toxin, Type IV TA system
MKQPRNLAASVRQRLLNLAHSQNEEFHLLLVRFGIERLLYRLHQSPASDRFVLKGAMLFVLWSNTPHRATKDVDLLCRGDNSVEEITAVFREVCQLEVAPDGLEFDADSVTGTVIKADREYPGVRVRLTAFIAGTLTRIDLQVDVGFGDVVTPAPQLVNLPAMLPDLPMVRLYAYNRETVVAEKFEAMVLLGMGNTRMKDFYDLWYLSQNFSFEGRVLSRAIAATFDRRRTPIPTNVPMALTDEFALDDIKQRQWAAFTRKGRLDVRGLSLQEIGVTLQDFLIPPTTAIAEEVEFESSWSSAYGWQ